MKQALTFLLGMLLGACTAYQPAAQPFHSPEHHVDGAAALRAVTVALLSPVQLEPFCSGVYVSQTAIVTAQHCVAHLAVGEPVAYVDASMVPRFAALAAADPTHDLALLSAYGAPRHAWASLAPGLIAQGSFAQTMGHPVHLSFSYSSGDVSGVRVRDLGDDDLDPLTQWVQTTAPISKGSSGCGLFDSQARLLGIAHGIVDDAQSLNLFVHKAHIEAFMRAQGSTL